MDEWKSWRIENEKGIEKWENKRDLIFSHLCLVGKMEKSRNGKLICLVEMKNGRMENKVGINLPLCPYYIKQGKYYLLWNLINKFTSYKN